MEHFERRTELPVSAEELFLWHTRAGAFQRLQPPWEAVRVLEHGAGLVEGKRVVIEVPLLGPWRKRWVAEMYDVRPGEQFRDRQLAGPFAVWEHTHRFEPRGSQGSTLIDQIDYAVPLGALGRLVAGNFVRRKLERVFRYRHEIMSQDLAYWTRPRPTAATSAAATSAATTSSLMTSSAMTASKTSATAQTAAEPAAGVDSMRIAISGSTGLVGTALIPFLTTGGHEVIRMVRSNSSSPSKELVQWNPDTNSIQADGLEGVDAVVHLAGENIAGGRWNAARKTRIRESRVQGTRLLCETLAQLRQPPKVLVCASAIGYYGHRGDEVLTESSPPGQGFLAEVCQAWEAATAPAQDRGIRVVHARLGVVLSAAGGALAKMLLPFQMGVGGIVGSGQQFMSWIALDDVIGAVHHAIVTESLSGPVNVVAPQPVTNREFTKTLGKVLSRPTLLPMPAFAARLALGEMADELLLASSNVQPKKLLDTRYPFRYPQLESALRHVLGR